MGTFSRRRRFIKQSSGVGVAAQMATSVGQKLRKSTVRARDLYGWLDGDTQKLRRAVARLPRGSYQQDEALDILHDLDQAVAMYNKGVSELFDVASDLQALRWD